eukprot:4430904-Ditylum_brightwellii.AAC.1
MAKNSFGSSTTTDEASPHETLFDRASYQEFKELVNDLPAECQNMPLDEQRAAGEQTGIGWRRLFNGQLTKQLALLQDDHLHH